MSILGARTLQTSDSNVVVTGASGFIGRSLVAYMRGNGHTVIGLTRAGSQHKDSDGDLVAVEDYGNFSGYSGAVVIHLAEPPRADRAALAELPAQLIGRIATFRPKRLVYASSALVYQNTDDCPRRETDPVGGDTAYVRDKLSGEAGVLRAGGAVARLTSLYGAGIPPGNIFADLLAQIHTAGPLQLRDLSPIRDWMAVEDAVAGLTRLALSGMTGIYNLGTGRGASVGLLARMLLDAAGQTERDVVATRSGRAGAGISLVLNAENAAQQLGWRARISLRDGLENILAAHRQMS